MQEIQEKNFIDIFKDNFSKLKNKKIVLYGLGIKTQLVLENLDFNFIGLMDKEPDNTDKTFFGLKVLSYQEVIKSADLIIIVSGDVYFQTIFSRIEFLQKDHNIPIYFCDGNKAKSYETDLNVRNNPLWKINFDLLKAEIDKNEIISFDIFDTLITRKVTEPIDIFKIIENKTDKEFSRARIKAELDLGNFATIEKIYKNLPEKYKIGYKLEQELELIHSIPRVDMIEAFNYAVNNKKEVYLISDIYHSREFLNILLDKAGVKGYKDILISSEIGKRKSDKTLWKYYTDIIGSKKALHIGDNLKDDIEHAKDAGINTFYIQNTYNMLKNSTLKNIVPKICSLQESLITGNIISRIFNSPFALSRSKGQPVFDDLKDIGYVFYAPVLFTYLIWILQENIKNKTDKILFVARDGYFLEKLYNYIVQKLDINNAPKAEYLIISRALTTILSIEKESDIEKVLKIKFQGKLNDYFKIRFGININSNEIINTGLDMEIIKQIIEENKTKIFENAEKQRKFYNEYLIKIIGENEIITIVDPSFNGTNQAFLSKFLNKTLKGYYCNANLSKSNPNTHNMKALFQSESDLEAKHSNLRKNTQFFEDGILVAPNGICLKINEDLTFEYSELGNTQKNFQDKETIFGGILEFFDDMLANYSNIDNINISPHFVDFVVGEIYSQNTIITDKIKDTFFADTMYETVYDRKMFE